MANKLESVRAYVDSIFNGIEDMEEKRAAYIHSYGVAQCCALLAAKRSLDTELATAIELLHDVYSYKTGVHTLHSQNGAEMVRVAFKQNARTTKNMTQAELAKAVGVSLRTMVSYENGESYSKKREIYGSDLYRFVHGQTEIQMPQVPSVTLNTFPLSMTAFLQLIASSKLSRSICKFHVFPLIACPGQCLTHSSHFPQSDSLMGAPTVSGISVNTPFSRIAFPYSFVIKAAAVPRRA